jgi:hypothetical protein
MQQRGAVLCGAVSEILSDITLYEWNLIVTLTVP